MDLPTYQLLHTRAEKKKMQAERVRGALDAARKALKQEFKCNTVKEAQELLTRLQKEKQNKQKKYEQAVAAFLKKYPDLANAVK
jgi:preprotein translocase subunit SecF